MLDIVIKTKNHLKTNKGWRVTFTTSLEKPKQTLNVIDKKTKIIEKKKKKKMRKRNRKLGNWTKKPKKKNDVVDRKEAELGYFIEGLDHNRKVTEIKQEA